MSARRGAALIALLGIVAVPAGLWLVSSDPAAMTLAGEAQRWVWGAPPVGVDASLTSLRQGLVPRAELLTEEQARARIAERDAAKEDLAARIAAGGPGAVIEVRDAWAGASSQERLVLVAGLRDNASPEALDALADLYEASDLFRIREEILRALGEHELAGAHPLLLSEAAGADDERLAQIAAGALFGESAALGPLAALVRSDATMNARLEAIHSIAGVGTPEAAALLGEIAEDPALEARVQLYAAKEVERLGSR